VRYRRGQQTPGHPKEDVVTESGRYIGQDPDANIRAELRRDSSSYLGNG